MKILLVEDEQSLGESIVSFLTNENYVCEWAKDYNDAEVKINLYNYDCTLVDLTLPGGNGLRLVDMIKKKDPKTGIIIISAKNSIDDKVTGLDLGSDDYLTKPFHLSELNSRIKSVIRRRNFEGSREIIVSNIRIIPETQELFVSGKPVNCTKKEFTLLLFFISNKNRVLTKEAIAEHLWGDHADMFDSFDLIYSHVKNLRKKIFDENGNSFIQSVYGVGYKFLAS